VEYLSKGIQFAVQSPLPNPEEGAMWCLRRPVVSAASVKPAAGGVAPEAVKKNYLTALKEALDEEMGRNPGHDLSGVGHRNLAAPLAVTDRLHGQIRRQRVVDMPISEGCIIGSAVGLALAGKTVMAEMQFIDSSLRFDQIVNMMATYHYRTRRGQPPDRGPRPRRRLWPAARCITAR